MWIKLIYFWGTKVSFNEIVAYIGNGGLDIEWVESEDFPRNMHSYRYKSVQHLIDNEHILKVGRFKNE